MRLRPTAIAIALAVAQPLNAQVIEEIIVTAQKRAENVMDVPIAISAYSGDALEQLGSRNLTDIGRFTAGVDMNNDKALQPTYGIRGVETSDWTIGSDPAVAVYVDGVYAARGAGAEAAFVDVERIEVLKGPQGTLFGRNATGGAIHIVTTRPAFEASGRIKLVAGNYDRREAEMVYNTALSDTLALRATASMRNRDGYLDQVAGPALNEIDTLNARVSLLWAPSEATDAVLRVAWEDMDQESGVLHTLNVASWEAANPGLRHDPFGKGAYDAPDQRESRESLSFSLEVNHEFDGMTLTSITGWRDFETQLLEDLDASNNPEFYFASANPEESTFFSQELRLTGASDRWKWTLGAVYTQEDIEHVTDAQFLMTTFESFALKEFPIDPELIPGFRVAARAGTNPLLNALLPMCAGRDCDGIAVSFFLFNLTGGAYPLFTLLDALQPRIRAGYAAPWTETVHSEGDYRSWALYGDTTYALTDATNLTVGVRYTQDDKSFDLQTRYQNELLPGVPFGIAFYNNGQPLLDSSESDDWGSVSGRIVLDHSFFDGLMAYASISTGFKSGGFNSLNFGPGIETSYDAEEVVNYEIGLKGSALDDRLRYTTAVFFYEYDNLQTLELIGQPIPSYNLRNADAEGKGFEAELAWAATDRLLFAANYASLEPEFTKYNIIPAAGETAADDLTGEPRAESPEHKYNLSAQYTHPIEGAGDLSARIDYTWQDERVDPTRGPVKDYGETNARLSFLHAGGDWEVALWALNLTDEEVITAYGSGLAVGSAAGWRLIPRMYGVDFNWNF